MIICQFFLRNYANTCLRQCRIPKIFRGWHPRTPLQGKGKVRWENTGEMKVVMLQKSSPQILNASAADRGRPFNWRPTFSIKHAVAESEPVYSADLMGISERLCFHPHSQIRRRAYLLFLAVRWLLSNNSRFDYLNASTSYSCLNVSSFVSSSALRCFDAVNNYDFINCPRRRWESNCDVTAPSNIVRYISP